MHEFPGTQAAKWNSSPGHEQAASAGLSLLLGGSGNLLPVIHTPRVEISAVNSEDPT